MTTEEAELLKQIEATYPDLDAWFARSRSRVEVPQPGSELAVDDQLYPASPISEVARLSLTLAVDHLRLVRVVTDQRQLFSSATFTTLRGALVGAAQGLWILTSDDRDVRRARGLNVVADELSQLGKYYREGEKHERGAVPDDQWEWHRQRTAQVAAARGEQQPPLNQTDMIAAALDAAFPASSDKRQIGRLLWRRMSADAHVLGWAVAQRAHLVTRPAKGEPLSVLAAPGTLADLAEPFLCAYALLRRGWALFDRRCEAP
ncbi:MAG: hypothetical protein M3O32_00750 [Actinomycetota bacterium]|nr:hypothetical protein [Actinomycetota bacterium]